MKLKLKNNSFEAIQVTGQPNQFHDLKQFCGEQIHIEYATCAIDDFWLITLDDDVKGKAIVVPNYDYIVKFGLDEVLTVMSGRDIYEYFEEVRESNEEE